MKPDSLVSTCLLGLLLGACGGGGGSGGPVVASEAAEGVWVGTSNQNRSMAALILGDGTYWVLYSVINDPGILGGLVQGSGSSRNSEFTSSNARDFNLEIPEITDGEVAANFAERQTFDGAAWAPGGAVTIFNLDYDAAYELTPTLNAIAGTYRGWSGTAAGIGLATVSIAADGTVIHVGGPVFCHFRGRVTPRPDGNAYDLKLSFWRGSQTCNDSIGKVSGVVFLSADGSTLYAATLNGSRTNGFIAIAERQ